MWSQDVLDSRNLYFILSNIIKSHVPITGFIIFPDQGANKAGNGQGEKYPLRLAEL